MERMEISFQAHPRAHLVENYLEVVRQQVLHLLEHLKAEGAQHLIQPNPQTPAPQAQPTAKPAPRTSASAFI